ncbi:MAG: Ig-like domain-containing protein [Thermoguttaceae bacterium]
MMFHAPWSRKKTHVARHCRKHNRLRLESLENRLALSAAALGQVAVNLTDSPAGQAIYGQLETFSVQVTPAASSAPTPTGIVDFMDGTIDLGNRRLNKSGNAVFNTRALDAGIHDLTAVYSGNSQFATATSNEVTDTVSPAPTLTTLDGLPSRAGYGHPVELTAYVAVASSNRGGLAGEVTFYDGSTSLGTASLGPGGFAKLAVSDLSVGSHTLTAVYGGDPSGNFSGSTSPGWNEVVTKGRTSVTIATSAAPSVIGQAVTFSAQVCLPKDTRNVTPPSGQVNFLADGVVIGSGTIDSTGNATFTTTSLALGSHAITAVYQGDENFSGSSSGILVEHVIKSTPGTAQGSGSIENGADTFSFTASAAYGSNQLLGFSGTLNFADTQDNVVLASTAINGLLIGPEGHMATIVGTATLNGQAGYHFCVTVGDSKAANGVPGSFKITICGPKGFWYENSGSVDAGGTITVSPASGG